MLVRTQNQKRRINMKINIPQVFIASSTEGLDIAYSVQDLLDNNAECTVWDQGVFQPSIIYYS